MNRQLQAEFIERWKRYFGAAELPLAYYYTDQVDPSVLTESQNPERCLIANLERVRQGISYVCEAKTPGCPGGKRYSGFVKQLRPGFEYFLSCGVPGQIEGERYKKSPELVNQFLDAHPFLEAPARYLVFRRWDRLGEKEDPLAVIFFATPDVLSGLFTLANYDLAGEEGVVTPMGAGCASILQYPLLESEREVPRCILGMFDVSARPCVPRNTLSFTVPMKRFREMVGNMDECFLITESWQKVRARLA